MKHEDRKVLKDIIRHRALEINLPAYGNAYINEAYEYCLVRLVLHYYTMKEVQDEGGIIRKDQYLLDVLDEIHTLMFETLLAEDLHTNYTEVIEKIHRLRENMKKKMTVLTAYTDALQIYEYVLNRIEYGITGENIDVDESALAAKVFRYLFEDHDKMVINSKIQMVTGQLPIRMTKNRFFDYLTDTLNIYIGSDMSSVDNFVSMLKSTALLELPEGYGSDYREVYELIEVLKETDYKAMDRTAYDSLIERFCEVTQNLTETVSNHLLAMEIINALYASLLAMPYENSETEGVKVSRFMLRSLHAAFVSNSEISEEVDDNFIRIEGLQEQLGEDLLQFESILPDVVKEHEDMLSWIMADKIFRSLTLISKLMSTSLYIDLEKEEDTEEVADSDYVKAKRDEMVRLLSDFFAVHSKEVNRSVMAALFSNMPVLFNSQQEIKDYIEYSLNHCGNPSELMACAKLLDDMMQEE